MSCTSGVNRVHGHAGNRRLGRPDSPTYQSWRGMKERCSNPKHQDWHKARHTSGQRMLDATKGNLKAAQKHLGHASIQTTADIYVDYDVDRQAAFMSQMLGEDDDDR